VAAEPTIEDLAVALTGVTAACAASGLAAVGATNAWMRMYCIAFGMLAALKWITWVLRPAGVSSTPAKSAAYLFVWPGMDVGAFMSSKVEPASPHEWGRALGSVFGGAVLVWIVAPLVCRYGMWLYGAMGMAGLICLVHFGLFHIASLILRRYGCGAAPTMNRPFAAVSLSELWGRRWNRPFRDFSHRFIFRPLAVQSGTRVATLAVFVFSGILHDLVISVPAGGGYGLPTVYFLIQYIGLEFERSAAGETFGLNRPRRGRLFTFAVTLLPTPLLFHAPFIYVVVVPFMEVIGAVAPIHANRPWEGIMETCIIIGGIMHFSILIASALVPRTLDWKGELSELPALFRQVIWVHGAFIVIVIVGFGALSVGWATELAAGSPLARALCTFISVFWGIRLLLQFSYFDPSAYLTTPLLRCGYQALTVVFAMLTLIYGAAALTAGGV
jgi:alginate O-acetyltransferase complex protein AlgI